MDMVLVAGVRPDTGPMLANKAAHSSMDIRS